jgi:type III secretion protein J
MRKLYIPTIILSLILFVFSACESNRTIVNDLEEKDANEILVFLAGKNIDAVKVPVPVATGGGGAKIQLYNIAVPVAQAVEAMAILNANGLPRRRGQNLLNLFQAGGLVPSEMQDKIRYEAGLAEQIANTIRKIDGVLDADVQLSFPEEDPLNPTAPKGKVVASVYVKHSGVLDDPNSQLISKIKRLVASSVTGLDYDNVNVIADRARFDVAAQPGGVQAKEQKLEYAKVWTIIVAKSSLSRLQTIFLIFSICLLLMTLVIVWLLWKLHPLMKKRGGFGKLFALSPLPEEVIKKTGEGEKKEPLKPGEKPKEGGPTPPTKGATPGVQENVESP